MGVIGNIALLVGSILYSKYFYKFEWRKILAMACLITALSAFTGVCQVLKYNQAMGISDEVWYAVQAFFGAALIMAFFDLPQMVLFAKVTPKHIEGTVFALLTGAINFSSGVLAPAIGSFINDEYIHVTTDNMTDDNFLILACIETITSFLPLLFIMLIPLRSDVEAFQRKMEEKAKAQQASKDEQKEDGEDEPLNTNEEKDN